MGCVEKGIGKIFGELVWADCGGNGRWQVTNDSVLLARLGNGGRHAIEDPRCASIHHTRGCEGARECRGISDFREGL
jgi:hypothetical protein